MFSFLKLLPSTAAAPTEECTGYPTPSAAGISREETSLTCTFIIAHNLCCSVKTLAVSKCIARSLQKPAAIFLCRLKPFPDFPDLHIIIWTLLSSVNQGWLNATSQVHPCPGLPPLLIAKAQHRSLLARSSLFVASVEQESRSRPQCWALKHHFLFLHSFWRGQLLMLTLSSLCSKSLRSL